MLRYLLCFASLTLTTASLIADPPTTTKEPVTDVYHGTKIVDPYRWLEDWSDPKVKEWSETQNQYARSVLDKLPGVDKLRVELKAILSAKTTSHYGVTQRGGHVFAIRSQPPKEQPFLVVFAELDDPKQSRTLVDPSKLDAKGTTSIDWFVPSPKGDLVAVSLSKGGSESGDVHIFETKTGKQVYEVVARVNGGTAGGDLAWTPDGKGFFYTRYPRGKERSAEDMNFFQQVYHHTLGTPTEKDRYEIGKAFPRIAEITLEMNDASGEVLATVQNGDSGEFAHYLRSTDGNWRQFTSFKKGIVQATFGPEQSIYLVSRAKAPRGKILRIGVKDLDVATATVVVPEGKETIVTDFYDEFGIVLTENRIYAVYQLGGPTELRAFDLEGQRLASPKQLPISTVAGVTPLQGDDILFTNGSFVEPVGWYVYRAGSNRTVQLPLTTKSKVSFDDIEVVREFATSKDGTKVPMTLLFRKGTKRTGKNPAMAYGYGGFNVSIDPRLRPSYRVLFDRGFVIAIANLRGGSEFGEDWHRAGNLTNKQNVFDDFAAVLKHLAERKYTSPEHLAILGGSNGGLLMGAMITQHPDLFRVAVSHVGIYDMLRVELSPNGAFNIPEYGTVKNPEHFKALRAYSPYHNVKAGVDYPPTLFLTGANDPRVDPMQSRKMTARLQSATGSDAPILLRTSAGTGHGSGTSLSKRIEEYVDVYAFLLAKLGVK